jgi:hypothetical protein
VSPQLIERIRTRAKRRCEYCLLPDSFAETPFQVDHIIAEKHSGPTHPDNLAWACFYCNNYKGPNVAGVDPITRQITRLFHPRTDRWHDHFQLHDGVFAGLTPIGRTTIHVLNMNLSDAISVRLLLAQRER